MGSIGYVAARVAQRALATSTVEEGATIVALASRLLNDWNLGSVEGVWSVQGDDGRQISLELADAGAYLAATYVAKALGLPIGDPEYIDGGRRWIFDSLRGQVTILGKTVPEMAILYQARLAEFEPMLAGALSRLAPGWSVERNADERCFVLYQEGTGVPPLPRYLMYQVEGMVREYPMAGTCDMYFYGIPVFVRS